MDRLVKIDDRYAPNSPFVASCNILTSFVVETRFSEVKRKFQEKVRKISENVLQLSIDQRRK